MNGKNFALRGVDEQYNLRFSQIVRSDDGNQYTYIEHGSKNHSGNLDDNGDNKIVPIRRVVGAGERDHVTVLDAYLSCIPSNLPKDSRFYLQPMSKVPAIEGCPWFFRTSIGINKVKVMVKDMCADAKIEGNFTNHSLRATGASLLFNSGCSEALIKKRTGHKSMDSLRKYERTTVEQVDAMSKILSSSAPVLYDEALRSSMKCKGTSAEKEQPKNLEDAKNEGVEDPNKEDHENSDDIIFVPEPSPVTVSPIEQEQIHAPISRSENVLQDVTNFSRQLPVFQHCTFNNCTFSTPLSYSQSPNPWSPSYSLSQCSMPSQDPDTMEYDEIDAPFGSDLDVFSFYKD